MEQDQEGEEERERVEGWVDREWAAAEAAEWAVPGPEPDRGEDVSARPAEPPLPISQGFPVLRPGARNAGLPWFGHKSASKLEHRINTKLMPVGRLIAWLIYEVSEKDW